MIRIIRTLGALALAVCAALAHGQSYPVKPVRIVVPFPAGGTTDILAREAAQRLTQSLGQPFVVDNRPGAGGNIGAELVAKAPADGYAFLMGTVGTHAINASLYNKLPYDHVRDFAPVILVAGVPNVLVVNPSVPANNVQELIAYIKANPGKVNFASSGSGTSIHLAGELFKTMSGVTMTHVPYKGSAPALTDVLAGHVPLMFDLVTTAVPNVKQGKLKALAVTGAARSPLLPDVPTVAESGLAGFEVSAWFALFAPAKVPAPILKRLSDDTYDVLRTPEMQARLRELGMDPDTRAADAFSTYVRGEVQKYGAVVKQAGLAP